MPENTLKMFSIEEKLGLVESILRKIFIKELSFEDKLEIIRFYSTKNEFLNSSNILKSLVASLKPRDEFVILAIVAMGQGAIVLEGIDSIDNQSDAVKKLIEQLWEVENFYGFMGGIVGYYHSVLSLIAKKNLDTPETEQGVRFHRPPGTHLDALNESGIETRKIALRWGIENLPLMAHIYPLGGAGDRLDLRDDQTGESLPVAYLQMGGMSLLEGMIRDLQAIEYFYWKLYGKQIIVPIAMMTSLEKDNATHVQSICQRSLYFGRPESSFRQFVQPLVPVITEEGDFSLSAPLKLVLKPGGHGVLWKLADEQGIFEWLQDLKKKKLLIRQINNPVANTNGGLLAFSGIGCQQQKAFGFLSCERLLNAAEGMLVLSESKDENKFKYCMSNIEYTDFNCRGVQDLPKEPGGFYSAFPANTNILFADLASIREISQEFPLPGLLMNMKNKVPFYDENGTLSEMYGGRLESMMQNIADSIVDQFPSKLQEGEDHQLRCYTTYGKRQQIISVTKNQYIQGKSIRETPEGCFYDQQQNCHDLLTQHCKMLLPIWSPVEEYLKNGPAFIVRYHPALGSAYEVIAQKVYGGHLTFGSYFCMEISEVDIKELSLDGSLSLLAKDVLGHKEDDNLIQYSHQNGKCELNRVRVVNKGVDREAKNNYWKNELVHREQLEIILHGNAEFSAQDVVFEGSMRIEVPSGIRLEVTMVNGTLHYQRRSITSSTWHWSYSFAGDDSVKLMKKGGG